jgi:hypothetical protein
MFIDCVRKHGVGKKIRSEHTWWPLRSTPAAPFAKFPNSVLLSDQLGVSETDLAKALGCSSVTEKRLAQHAGGSSFVVRKFNNLLFATVLKLGSNVAMLPSDVVPSHETIAQKHWSEVDALRQSTMRCRTRNDMSRAHETVDSANIGQKRGRQEDGRAADAGKKSKVQDRKDIIRKRLKTMTADDTATFVDHLFSTIQILCGLIHQSRAAVVRSSVEPTVAGFGSEVTIIDLTSMMNDDDIMPAADDFEHLPAPARTSRFYPQDLELPSGATVQIPNNCCNKLFTVSDVARYRKERKIVDCLRHGSRGFWRDA